MKKQKGISLVEILIVLGIIGAVMAALVQRPQSSQKDYNRFFRRFSLMSKRIRNQAMVENATYRMLFKLEEDKAPTMWVERTKKSVLLGDEKESKKKFEELYKDLKSKKKTKKEKPSIFKKVPGFSFANLKMPRNLNLKLVEVSGIDEPLEEEGLIAFHYFPQGLVEETALQITALNTELEWTLISEPLNGNFVKVGGLKSLKDLQER